MFCFHLVCCIMKNKNKMGLYLPQIYFKIQIMKLLNNVKLNFIEIPVT